MAHYGMEGAEDRLSKLPNSLIFLILSFLSMRDVVKTTLLSKRWKNLWTTTPYLNFHEVCDDPPDDSDDDDFDEDYVMETSVRNFVYRTLLFWKGIKILRFSIEIECVCGKKHTSLESDIGIWVRFAVENGVEELKLHTRERLNSSYEFPQCLNSCSSLRKLSLFGCCIEKVGYPAWNQLKSLKIIGVGFWERSIDQILLGCPQLEVFELRVLESCENLNITSLSLKKLLIRKFFYYLTPGEDVKVVRICCPNLETLEISGFIYKCLVTDMPHLTDATLGSCDPRNRRENELLGETLRKILPTIQHVEKLTLSFWCVQVLCALQKKCLLSPLPNIKILKLYVDGIIEPDGIMDLLGNFPNLKTLAVIEDPDIFKPQVELNSDFVEDSSDSEYFGNGLESFGKGKVIKLLNVAEFETFHSNSFPLQLKTIEITSKLSDASLFRLMESLLKHAPMLEKLIFRADNYLSSSRKRKTERYLMSMPRSSPTVEVIFFKKE